MEAERSSASRNCRHFNRLSRRDAILVAAGSALAPFAFAASKPNRRKPQPGDILVHAFGDKAGAPIAPAEVFGEPLAAFPMEPTSKLVRDGSLHNQLALVRTSATALASKALRYAVVDGEHAYLAYSAACTHTGCEVNGWKADTKRLVCPCHGSEFDVADAGRVTHGPAPKPLAMLQIALEQHVFRVSGGFSRRVGPAPP